MKTCPACNTIYAQESMNFCLVDGAALRSAIDQDRTLLAPTVLMIPSSEVVFDLDCRALCPDEDGGYEFRHTQPVRHILISSNCDFRPNAQ